MKATSLEVFQPRIATNNSSQTSRTTESSQQSNSTFSFEDLLNVLLEDGFNALLDKLKELKANGIISSIKIVTDASTGKTTISGEYDGVEFEFIGNLKSNNEVPDVNQPDPESTLTPEPDLETNNTDGPASMDGVNGEEDTPTQATPEAESETKLTTVSDAASTIQNKISTYITGSEINMYAKIYSKIHTEFGLDSNGKIIFQESSTQEVYDYLKDQIVTDMTEQYPDEVAALGGAEGLERILQAAWIETYSSFNSSQSNDTKAFVNKVVANLKTILSKISNNQDLLEVYTGKANYADKTLTTGLSNYSRSSAITYSNGAVFTDGSVHIDDNASDKLYQQTMTDLLERLKAKYPDLSEADIEKLFQQAQLNALRNCVNNTADCPYGTDNGGNDRVYDAKLDWGGKDSRKGDKNKILMQELVQLVLYNFDKLMYANPAGAKDTDSVVPDNIKPAVPTLSNEESNTIKTAASEIKNKISTYITSSEINMMSKIYSKIHTEFGLDSNGKIIFQESSTKEVYDYMKDQIVTDMTERYPDFVEALGGSDGLERLLQAAWIETYSSFNSSQSNDTKAFMNKVVSNLQTILSKISNNPELLEVYTSHTNYTDKTLTDGLENYKNSSAITYSDADIYMDGSVHIQDTQSDKLYQQTMSSLLDKLKAKYPKLDESVIAKLFKQAQVNALNNCANNTADCPYGTDNGGNDRVYDTKLDWGGKDSRKGDKNKILMQELVQLVLYHFDKLLYAQAA